MTFDDFSELLKVVRFNHIESLEDFEKEFKFLIENSPKETFLEGEKNIINSDFFRAIFLERNL